MLKRILKSPAIAVVGAFLITAYIRLVAATSRRTVIGDDRFDEVLREGGGAILAFWHGRLLMAPIARALTSRDVYMLISNNRDGELIASSVAPFGLKFIRGSASNPRKPDKNKSGASAIIQIHAALRNGDIVGLTPDGPRGPGEHVQLGIVRLAKKTGAPIVPAVVAASPAVRLDTWDRFLLPTPFARLAFIAGPPIRLGADFTPETLESDRLTVENALKDVTREADILVAGGAINERHGRNPTTSAAERSE